MKRAIAIVLLVNSVVCGFGQRGSLPNDFSQTRKLLMVRGHMFKDQVRTIKLTGITIEVFLMTNVGDKYGKKGKIKPGFVPRYKRIGVVRTGNQDRFVFHIDLQREYKVEITKPGYERSVVHLFTYFKTVRNELIMEYGMSRIMKPYKPGEIGPHPENLLIEVKYNKNEKQFRAKDELLVDESEEAAKQKREKEAAKRTALDLSKARKRKKRKLETIYDFVKEETAMLYGEDTINLIDQDGKKQSQWIYFGAQSQNTDYRANAPYFAGKYNRNDKIDLWLKYHPNEQIAAELQFNNDTFAGPFKMYYPNGNLEGEGIWSRKLERHIGNFKLYYQEGGMKARFRYNDTGVRDGTQLVYYPDGNLAVTSTVKNGYMEGYMIVYAKDGSIITEQYYEQGTLVKEKSHVSKKFKYSEEQEDLIILVTEADTVVSAKLRATLSELDQLESNYQEILQKRLIDLREARKELSDKQLELLKAQKALSKEKLLVQLRTEELNRQRIVIFSVIGGLLLMSVLLTIIFRNSRERKKANEMLTFQKEEIQEKNREITDSITYAKRLQEAILPTGKLVEKWLPESFICFKPKDIVSGDFYWVEEIDGLIYFAAIDCTGHGVPGAMVSVVGHNAISRCIGEFRLREPAHILDKLAILVEETFDKSEQEVKDGMDMALCCLDRRSKVLKYAGANNPMYRITKLNGTGLPPKAVFSDSHQVEEVKPDKQPIGKYADRKHFTNHQIQLLEGDSIYVFSDGFADQFGGPKGKKFKYKPFKELLISVQEQPMDEQKRMIETAFSEWKGALEQVDDVCIIGVKV